MPLSSVAQKQFLKGVNAAAAYNAQPKGTVPRASNLVLSTRGALRSCDQNLGICTWNGNGPTSGEGPFTSIQFFQPGPALRKILALQRDIDTQVPIPTALAAALGTPGSSLPNSTYFYVVTAIDGAGGETPASNEVTITTTGNDAVNLSWTASPNAAGYNIYRGAVSGADFYLTTVTGTTFTDSGLIVPAASTPVPLVASPAGIVQTLGFGGRVFLTFTTVAPNSARVGGTFIILGATPSGYNGEYQVGSKFGNSLELRYFGTPLGNGGGGTLTASTAPPLANSTQVLSLIDVSGLSFTKPGSIIKSFPSGQFPPDPSFPAGAVGGSYSGASGGGTLVNPAPGNIVGQSGPLPDMIPFTALMILALGNGIPPYQSDGTNAGTIPLANTFTGAFPDWFANTAYAVGDIISPGGAPTFTFIVTQAGVSGTSEPAWNTGMGALTADNTVQWAQNGANAVPAPRGAAHAINHAASLWLWNTSPTNSADNLDGPSCLKMSDANNPNSWNPLNTAFVGENDGQQGMGMASFTIAESGIPPEGSLVLFKEFSTYQVTGVFGASDFAIIEAQTALGCIAPRTIKFVPGFGIMRLTHLGVAVFDGVRDRLISEDIRPYLFGGISDISQMDFSWCYAAKADVVAIPPMYCLAIPVINNGQNGSLTRLCCYDLILKAWTIIDLPFGIESMRQLIIPGSEPVTVFGGFQDAMISRWQVGDQCGWQAWLDPSYATHSGTPLVWSVRTPSALGQSANDRVMFRRAVARGNWQGTPSTCGIVDPTFVAFNLAKSHEGNFTQGGTGTYTVVVTNEGNLPTSGPVIVTELPPPGLTFVSMTGTGWTVSGNVATNINVLAPGNSYPPLTITVSVASDATSPQVNEVSVGGGGAASVVTTADSTTIEISLAPPYFNSHSSTNGAFDAGPVPMTVTATGAGINVGDIGLVCIRCSSSPGVITGAIDSLGNIWSIEETLDVVTGLVYFLLSAEMGTQVLAGGTFTFTATVTAGDDATAVLMDFVNCGNVSEIDQIQTFSTTSASTFPLGPMTTAQDDGFIYFANGVSPIDGFATPTDWVFLFSSLPGAGPCYGAYWAPGGNTLIPSGIHSVSIATEGSGPGIGGAFLISLVAT